MLKNDDGNSQPTSYSVVIKEYKKEKNNKQQNGKKRKEGQIEKEQTDLKKRTPPISNGAAVDGAGVGAAVGAVLGSLCEKLRLKRRNTWKSFVEKASAI